MQIATAAGASGPNYDYLHNLADAMRGLGVEDDHLFDLDARVRAISSAATDAAPGATDGAPAATDSAPAVPA